MRSRTALLGVCFPILSACGSNGSVGSNSSTTNRAPGSVALTGATSFVNHGFSHPLGVLAVSRVQYDGNSFGSTETYPTIFNDPTITGVQGSIHIDRYLVAPGVPLVGSLALTGITTSFSSKSEGALMRSVDGRYLTYMGYDASVGLNNVSNSFTEDANLAGNTAPLFDRAVARVDGNDDVVVIHESNAYSGDNPRAAVSVDGQEFYMAGNSDSTIATDGTGPGTTIGARLGTLGLTTSIELGVYTAADRPDESAKQHVKDSDFRGVGIYNGNLYVSKGSGGNGDDGLFQVHAGTGNGLPTGTGNTISLLFGDPATQPTTGVSSPLVPFGFWFADDTTVYVADEGNPNTDANGNLIADPLAGLQKWKLVSGAWKLKYTLSAGLGLDQAATIAGYPVPTFTYGLRNMTGQLNADGTVTIYAITSQFSSISGGEPDPTRLVMITDRLAATTLPSPGWFDDEEQFVTLKESGASEVFRGVALALRPVESPLAATKRVLLLSVDGMHQQDLSRWIDSNPTSTLAKLADTGVQYQHAHTTTPSDSFPGTVALFTGGTPKSTGVYYDDSYDRTLYSPGDPCTGEPGTEAIFDESIDHDSTKLFSGGIDPAFLPNEKDAQGNCRVVYPHDFVKVNTLFEVVKASGGYTAWSDKHPAYDILNGPSGVGIDDLYTPEQASLIADAPAGLVNGVALSATLAECDGTTNSLPIADLSDYTTCMPAALAYDDVKVQAIVNEIEGKRSDGSGPAPVPVVFGMNFQAVSVGEKLPVGGYVDAAGSPSAVLAGALAHVDASIGKFVTALKNRGLLDSTLIIVTAKHGQSPIDKTKLAMEAGGNGNATVQDPLPFIDTVDPAIGNHPSTFVNPNSGIPYDTDGHLTTDDVGILWVQHTQDSTSTASLVTVLRSNAAAIFADSLPADTVFQANITSGSALAELFGDPTSSDPVAAARAPDVFIQPNWGTIYSGSSQKIAEHGGGTLDDQHVGMLVSLPAIGSRQSNAAVVHTTQVAPTILRALRLDPERLQAVVKEGTSVLPGLF